LRFKHGSVYTPEYQPDLDFENHAWEESRGMGYSYGYNREEDAWDYNSTQSLVYHLLDKVSRGGNFLLDIGPDEHGKIPPIMEERLLQIGDWLKINGAAIYGTERWKRVSQWTEGRQDYKAKKGEDIMMKLTVDPEPGFAVKEVFYTYNAAKNNLYAVFPRYPSNKKLVLKNMPVSGYRGDIHFLSTGEKLKYDIVGDNLVIMLPDYDPNKIKAPYAYAVEIGNFGAFVHKPQMNIAYEPDLSAATVTITDADPGAKIQFSLQTNAQLETKEYTGPFTVKGNALIRAMAFRSADAIPSDTATASIVGLEMMKAVKPGNLQKGLAYRYYESDRMNMKILGSLQPVKTGVTDQVSVALKQRPDRFGLVFTGYIRIPATGGYEFATTSDDGSILTIDDTEVVNNDGNHGQEEKTGRCLLEKGYHSFQLRYFDSGGGNGLSMQYRRMGGAWISPPGSMFFHP
ncbi:MAG: alpha-L-fucosidase, partial [Bacteroidota bacterium]|nr:alpha-L-fucosidase [Bacteroidota bacterium]